MGQPFILPHEGQPLLHLLHQWLGPFAVLLEGLHVFLLLILGQELAPTLNHKWVFPSEAGLERLELAEHLLDHDETKSESVPPRAGDLREHLVELAEKSHPVEVSQELLL